MNYIKRLERTIQIRAAEMVGLRSGLADLKVYLMSAKFHNDPTVQVADVLRRLEEAERFADQLAAEQGEMD